MFEHDLTGVKLALVSSVTHLPLQYVVLCSRYPANQTILLVQAEVGVGIIPFASEQDHGWMVEVQFLKNDSKIHHIWRSSGWGDGILRHSAMEQRLENDGKTILMCEFRISFLEENLRLPGDLWQFKFPRPVHQVLVLIVGPKLYQELNDFKFPQEVKEAISREAVHA